MSADLESSSPAGAHSKQAQSLDEIDRRSFAAEFTPWDGEAEQSVAKRAPIAHPAGPVVVSLDGEWQLAEGGKVHERLGDAWSDAIAARVPGSVHTALVEAGRLPDPTFGLNQALARQESFKTWWMRRQFKRGDLGERAQLSFGGIANRCTVWLNGKMLGGHEGMFGGPDFEIGGLLEDDNVLGRAT